MVSLLTGSLVLPAFVRNEYATRSIATCIDPRQEVVNIYLVRGLLICSFAERSLSSKQPLVLTGKGLQPACTAQASLTHVWP